jgi:hypothetical protein
VLAEARLVAASIVLSVDLTRIDVAAISSVVRVGRRRGFALDSPAYGGAPRRLIGSALTLSVPELPRPGRGSRLELVRDELDC